MKLNKIFTLGLLSLFGLASCDNAEEPVYTPADPSVNTEVCFKRGEATTIQLKEDQSSFDIVVYRTSSEGSATYTLEVSDIADIYTSYPTEVVFADGQKEAKLPVGLDFSKVVPLEKYNITFTLPGVSTTDYYLGSITYTCYYEPWKVVTGPNGETAARWRDNILWGLFSWPEEYSEWEVTIEQSPSNSGIYRIQNPYRNSEYLEGAVDTSDDLYIYFNIEDPDKVFFCDKDGAFVDFTSTGVNVNPEYGVMFAGSEANYAMADGEEPALDDYGKFKNGNLTWGARKMLVAMGATGKVYYANGDGLFRVVWPGYEPAEDPENTWTTIGEAQFTDGWMSPYLGDPAPTVPVTVQQNGANPAYYRLVAPFSYLIGETLEGTFMYLDCSDAENVLIPLQESATGLSMGTTSFYASNKGEVLMNWQGEDGATADQVIQAGYNSTFDGTTILVPANNVVVAGATNGQLGIEDIEAPADGVIVLPTAEQTAAYKKANHFEKYVTRAERRSQQVKALFDGKIVKTNNISELKKLIKK